MSEAIIKVEHLSKSYNINPTRTIWAKLNPFTNTPINQLTNQSTRSQFYALRDINFEVKKGEILGLIGPNGAGKTTLLKVLCGVSPPTEGNFKIKGKIGTLIDIGAGFHPEMTGRENVYFNGILMGMNRKQINKKFKDIVDFAELWDFIDTPFKKYSSGMKARLGFSVAIHIDPDVLLIDEVLAVGDENFRAKCFRKMAQFIKNNCAVIFVSHRMYDVIRICNRVLFLNHGKVVECGECSKVIQSYRNYASRTMNIEQKSHSARTKLEKVRITAISIKDSHGLETNNFYSGDEYRLEISYSTTEPIKNPVITVGIISLFDQLMSHYSTKGNLDNFTLNGDGLIVLNIHYLGLASGKWKIGVGIYDQDYIYAYTLEPFIKEIDVNEPNDNTMLGRFRLSHKWEVF